MSNTELLQPVEMNQPAIASWKEVSPGRFERPLDSTESLMYGTGKLFLSSDIEHFSFMTSLKLELDPSLGDPVKALRQAWKTMRYDYPSLATKLEDKEILVYQVPKSEDEIEAWLDETFVVSDCPDPHTFFQTHKPHPLVRLYYLPSYPGIALPVSHWRLDGTGAQQLLKALCQALASPRTNMVFGEEAARLAPGMDDVIQYPKSEDDVNHNAASKVLSGIGSLMPFAAVPTSTQEEMGQSPASLGHTLICVDPETTASILAAIKASSFSLAAVFQAALIHTTYSLASPAKRSRHALQMLIHNTRRYCRALDNESAYTLGMYIAIVPFTSPPPESFPPSSDFFWDIVRRIDHRYKTKLDAPYPEATDPAFLSYNPSYLAQYHPVFTSMPPPKDPNVIRDGQPWLNSLGLIDRAIGASHGDGKVKSSDYCLRIASATDDIPAHMWTEAGQLKIGISYNTAYWTEDDAADIIKMTEHCVRTELLLKNRRDISTPQGLDSARRCTYEADFTPQRQREVYANAVSSADVGPGDSLAVTNTSVVLS